jgi:hypothetical protein
MHPNEYQKLRAPEAAKFLRSSASTLAKWRMLGCGPRYQKLGRRIVIYDLNDLKAFAAAGSRTCTLDLKDAA